MGSLWEVNLKLNVVGGMRQKSEKRNNWQEVVTLLTPDLFNPQFLKLPNFSKQFLFPLEAWKVVISPSSYLIIILVYLSLYCSQVKMRTPQKT